MKEAFEDLQIEYTSIIVRSREVELKGVPTLKCHTVDMCIKDAIKQKWTAMSKFIGQQNSEPIKLLKKLIDKHPNYFTNLDGFQGYQISVSIENMKKIILEVVGTRSQKFTDLKRDEVAGMVTRLLKMEKRVVCLDGWKISKVKELKKLCKKAQKTNCFLFDFTYKIGEYFQNEPFYILSKFLIICQIIVIGIQHL